MQNRVILIEIVIFLILSYTIQYVGLVLMISSVIAMIYPYSSNQVINMMKYPNHLLKMVSGFIDQKIP